MRRLRNFLVVAIFLKWYKVLSNLTVQNLFQQALKLTHHGKIKLAVGVYNDILKLDPFNLDAAKNFTALNILEGSFIDSEKLILKFHNNNKSDIALLNHLSIIYIRTHRIDDAITLLKDLININPFFEDGYLNIVNAFSILKEHNEALNYNLKLIEINPSSSKAYNNLGNIFNNMALFEEAKIAFLTAVDLDKNNIEANINLASILSRQDKALDAIKIYEKILKKFSKDQIGQISVVKYLCSFEYLKTGNLKKGFNYFEFGFHPNIPIGSKREPSRTFDVPKWKGESLYEKKLLLWREQGIGDEILYYSIIPDVINKFGNNIILETDDRLVEILQRSFPNIQVRKQSFVNLPLYHTPKCDFDYHLPIASLCKIFRSEIIDFKNSQPYIKVSPLLKKKFNERLNVFNSKIKVGICWRSGTLDPLRNRSFLSIEKLECLFLQNNIKLINLQYGDCENELKYVENLYGIDIVRWNDVDLKNDLDDVFALISELDYVITVGTAVYEMSGAVGAKTFTLSTKDSWHNLGQSNFPWFSNVFFLQSDNFPVENFLPQIIDYIKKGGITRCLQI